MVDDFAAQVEGVGALAEPARRALYLYVVRQPGPVSRDEAAAGTQVPRHTAKFHLDKLVEEGLLDTEFRRLTGRTGPGAGRPSKLYRRSQRQVTVNLPERRYDFAGQILARALEDAADGERPPMGALQRAATAAGRSLARSGMRSNASGADALDEISEVLAAQGYEPRRDQDTVVLANCPFHELAKDHTQLVCGMNLDLISAALKTFGDRSVRAVLDPGPDRCCVKLQRSPGRSAHRASKTLAAGGAA